MIVANFAQQVMSLVFVCLLSIMGIADISLSDGMTIVALEGKVKEPYEMGGFVVIQEKRRPTAFQLNGFIFAINSPGRETMTHEKGHYLQQQEVGEWYVPVIGTLSISGNLFGRLTNMTQKEYHLLPWEKWADDLGGMEWR